MSEAFNQDPVWNAQSDDSILRDTVDYQYVKFENEGDVSSRDNYTVFSTDRSSYYYLPSAFLAVEYQVTKTNGDPIDTDTALASNGWSLFRDVRVSVEDRQIAQVDHPAVVSTFRNLIEQSNDTMNTLGPISHMYVDSVGDGHTGATVVPFGRGGIYVGGGNLVGETAPAFYPQSMTDEVQYYLTNASPAILQTVQKNPKFDPAMKAKVERAGAKRFVRLPLSDICGIFDMERVVKGSKLQVELNKADPRQALFGADATALLKISKVQLWIAKVRPSLKAQENFSSQLAKQSTLKTNFIGRHLITATSVAKGAGEHQLSIAHKVNKPTSVIIAFGYSDRFTNRALNPLQWDLQDRLSRVELRANNKQVPNVAYNPQAGDFTQILHDLYKLGGKDELESPVLTWSNWQSNYPIFGFDLSQAEGDSHESRSIMTLDLNWAFSGGADVAPYTIYVLINSESECHLDYANGLTTLRIN